MKTVKTKSRARELMRAQMGDIYEEIRVAKAAGDPICYSTSNFAKELFEVMGIKVVYPENHAAAVAAKKGAELFCEKAESLGYSSDLCSYARISIGFDERDEDFGHGLDIPAPDFLCVSNNICSTVNKWYENLAWKYDIPMIMLDVPYSTQADYEPAKIEYVKSQLQGIVERLEEVTGRTFDYDRFQEVLETSSENGRLFQEAMDLIGQTVPSPASAFDEYNFMALMIVARGKKETTEALKLFIGELQERIAADQAKSGIGSCGTACAAGRICARIRLRLPKRVSTWWERRIPATTAPRSKTFTSCACRIPARTTQRASRSERITAAVCWIAINATAFCATLCAAASRGWVSCSRCSASSETASGCRIPCSMQIRQTRACSRKRSSKPDCRGFRRRWRHAADKGRAAHGRCAAG